MPWARQPPWVTPALTPAAQQRIAFEAAARPVLPAGPEDRSMSERCITFGVPRTQPAYMSYYDIVQSRDAVVFRMETIHDARVILPPKSKATSEMESMIHHFKQVMEGPRPPIGECYVAVESPKGEKGYYFVSDGTAKPVRWRIRPPSYVNLSAIPRLVEGHLLSDVIAINASIDIVMGEIDR